MSKQQPWMSHSNIHLLSWLRPRQHVSGYFWIRYFFFPDRASVHTYLVNPACESATFFQSGGLVWTLNPDIFFLCSDVTRSSQVLYLEYVFKKATSTHLLLPIFLEESRVREWIRIRVGYLWTSKFELNTVTCGRGNFLNPERKSCEFKNIRIRVDGA